MKTAAQVAETTTSGEMIRKLRKVLDMIEEDRKDPLAESLATIARDNAAILLECIRQGR